MTTTHNEWIPISTPPKPEDFPVWVYFKPSKVINLFNTFVDGWSQYYTHWQKAIVPPPPPRPKTLEDIDREAFNSFDETCGDDWSLGNKSRAEREIVFLAARKDPREKLLEALKECEERPIGESDRAILINRTAFAKLTALLKGEQ